MVPSLILIAIAVATVVVMRPWLRRARLPYHARIAVILCVVSSTMVGSLLMGPWMNPTRCGASLFPVIVLGMLAEGIANTLDRDNAVTASWARPPRSRSRSSSRSCAGSPACGDHAHYPSWW